MRLSTGAKLTEMYEYVSATPASVVLGYVYAANAAGVSSALANVTVSLLDAAGDTLSSQLTSVWGGFDFYGVNAGTYQLRYSTPSGETLQAVKRQYDPDGLFVVHHGVGSEVWSADGFTRLA